MLALCILASFSSAVAEEKENGPVVDDTLSTQADNPDELMDGAEHKYKKYGGHRRAYAPVYYHAPVYRQAYPVYKGKKYSKWG